MKAQVFEKLEDLNKYLEGRRRMDTTILYKSFVVSTNIDYNGQKIFEVLDRFLVLEDDAKT